ncbi:MAG: glycosyltransferase [Rhodopseudomonas sp.]|nr:glycosyltransferase [Rhodopseudomonas sp.]
MTTVPVSVVIPTADRPVSLRRTLESLLASSVVPDEFIIIDASSNDNTEAAVGAVRVGRGDCPALLLRKAAMTGAAAQRNQAVALARRDHVLFCDDDIIVEPDCIARLWQALQSDGAIGGASAAIVNQSYVRPGWPVRILLATIGVFEHDTYAGRIAGPAIQFLPRGGDDLPATMPVQWLNTTCTLYRRALLPDPPFDTHFSGYSLGEDVALSLRVGRRAKLVNVPAARIVHDSQPGAHKADAVELSRMAFVNRHYIMTQVLGRNRWRDYLAMLWWEFWQLAMAAVRRRGGVAVRSIARGQWLGLADIVRNAAARKPRGSRSV